MHSRRENPVFIDEAKKYDAEGRRTHLMEVRPVDDEKRMRTRENNLSSTRDSIFYSFVHPG